MERTIAEEFGQLSVVDVKQCNSHNDEEEDEAWYEEDYGTSRDDSNGVFEKSSGSLTESEIIRNRFHTIGYREGIMEGKEASMQQGFNAGFKESVGAGFKWGCVRGVTSALASLPCELREKIIESQQVRSKFGLLQDSVSRISTADALKLFHDDISNKTDELEQRHSSAEQVQSSVLDKCYEELQTLILESPALKVQSKIEQE